MNQSRKQFWATHISQLAASGQSVSVYCKEHGIPKDALWRWRKRLSADQSLVALSEPRTLQTSFHEVHVSSRFDSMLDLSVLDQRTLCGIIHLLSGKVIL
jgi:hypothetical protein